MNSSKQAIVVGAGYGGLATAALLARDGWKVTVLEKNATPGGRARVWREGGFTFDMGPSWYLMPEVFDDFFALFGKKRSDYYHLVRLDPNYRIFTSPDDAIDVTSDPAANRRLFERLEPGSGPRLDRYLELSKFKYDVAMKEFMYVEYRNIFQFLNRRILTQGLKMNLFSSLDRLVSRFFTNQRAKQIMEYAMVFLGASPINAPALYSIMSHVDMNLGVWYPAGGFGAVVDALVRLCKELGVEFEFNAEVDGFEYEGGRITAARSGDRRWAGEVVVANADYHHVETKLLPTEKVSKPPRFWKKQVMAPTLFVVYLGLKRPLPALVHHNLYFTGNWDEHFAAIFDKPAWPENPCFYLSCPSKSDPTVAPAGKENLFLLVPVAAGLDDPDEFREAYANRVIAHVERIIGEPITPHIEVKRIYSQRDYAQDYNAYQGSALGLAHTLSQTAVFRPSIRSRKVPNLFYAGQYTHPGVGVPMVLIAAQLAAKAVAETTAVPAAKGTKP